MQIGGMLYPNASVMRLPHEEALYHVSFTFTFTFTIIFAFMSISSVLMEM